MKKKVKKIPKYSTGIPRVEALSPQEAFNAMSARHPSPAVAQGGSGFGGWGGAIGAAGTAAGKMLMDVAGVDDNSQLGVTLNTSMEGAEIGGAIMPGWGHLIGGVAGGLLGSLKKGSVDPNTGDIQYGGFFGRSKSSLLAESNRIKNTITNKQLTQHVNELFMSNPNNNINTNVYANAAEGGIIPNKEITVRVTAGEVYKNANTGEWGVVKGKGMNSKKPKKDDSEVMDIPKDSIILNTHPDYVFEEFGDKTPALVMRPLAKPIKTTGAYAEGTKAAIDATGKKVLRKQELRKQELHLGEIENKYSNGGYAQNWESDVMQNPIAQELFGQNKKYRLFTPQEIVERSGYNYGPTYANYNPNLGTYDFSDMLTIPENYLVKQSKNGSGSGDAPIKTNSKSKYIVYSPKTVDLFRSAATPEKLESLPIERAVGLMGTYDKDVDSAYRSLRNRKTLQKLPKFGNNLLGYLPLLEAVLSKPKYHKEEAIISPAKYNPVGVNPDPIRRAADESFATARYNQANINPNTGAGMAYGLQAASNRTKSLADAYKWLQEQQNRQIAQNVGIYNNWSSRYDDARYKAIENTMANEAAADAQRDARIKDAMGYLRDWQLTPFLKQYLSSGAYKENVERIS